MRWNSRSRDRRSRGRGFVLLLGLLAASVVPFQLRAAPDKADFRLGVGDERFWDGEYVPEGHVKNEPYFFSAGEPGLLRDASDLCGKPSSEVAPCFEYQIDVAEVGKRLRIAIDTSNRGDNYGFQVLGPDGRQADFVVNYPPVLLGYSFNLESRIEDPQPGTWTVKVIPWDVRDWAFRMRATLEGAPAEEPDLLTPNLVPWLPYEFGFVAPANPRAGSAPDHENPPGPRGVSCTWDETLNPNSEGDGSPGNGPTRCLRFSTGLHNVGDGPLYIEFDESGRAVQHVYHSDDTPGYYGDNEDNGNFEAFEAGTAEFHLSHGHRHYTDIVLYELFAVREPSGPPPYGQGRRLTPLGEGNKHGYCTGDQQMGRWHSFNQDRFNQVHSHEPGAPDCEHGIVLGKGWGDIYRWQRPGQYVRYDLVADPDGTMKPGFYVLRVTIDPNDRLVETRESDNIAYALIQVIDGGLNGDRVVICERGFGKSPWDPKKLIPEEPWWWSVVAASQAPATGDC